HVGHGLQLEDVVAEPLRFLCALLLRCRCGGKVLELVATEQDVLDASGPGEEKKSGEVIRGCDTRLLSRADTVDQVANGAVVPLAEFAKKVVLGGSDRAPDDLVVRVEHGGVQAGRILA